MKNKSNIIKFPFCILRSWFHIFCDMLERHLEKKYQKYYGTENKNDEIVINYNKDLKPYERSDYDCNTRGYTQLYK